MEILARPAAIEALVRILIDAGVPEQQALERAWNIAETLGEDGEIGGTSSSRLMCRQCLGFGVHGKTVCPDCKGSGVLAG